MKTQTPTRWEAAYQAYHGKIRTFARNSYRQVPGMALEDMEQELLIKLAECVIHYDPNRGASFNTYVQQSMKNRIITLIRHASTKSRKATVVSLDEDAVRAVAERYMRAGDPEEEAINRIMLDEYIAENGTEALVARRRKKRVAA